ncbi:hypothetical protein FRX31_027126 [Thalictrum thalictroides]|uniref:Uncharacterized protein n=1 Tax=Thalictrum thalictroides TaxID=46969 RepID=A0A7J6VDX0_THATH|nr:hypothetical protein FRX31_027126 [Thalictrum thalictroides]
MQEQLTLVALLERQPLSAVYPWSWAINPPLLFSSMYKHKAQHGRSHGSLVPKLCKVLRKLYVP